MKQADFIRGKDYNPTGFCLGCVPPWETCPVGCPDEFEHHDELTPDQAQHMRDILG